MRLAILILICCLSLSAAAQTSVWEVRDGDRRMFVAGTMHLLSASDFPLPVAYEAAYLQADTLVFEADTDLMADPYWQGQMQKALYLPAGQTLQQHLKPGTWAAVENFLTDLGLPVASMLPLSPSGFVTVISVVALRAAGLEQSGIDPYFLNKARADDKPAHFLEGVQQQLDFLARMGQGKEDELVLSTLDDIGNINELLAPMVNAWRAGDMDALDELGAAPMREDFPALYKMILVDRNKRWLPELCDLLATEPVEYVLVGALHLAGEDGVLHALREKGYQVNQLQ